MIILNGLIIRVVNSVGHFGHYHRIEHKKLARAAFWPEAVAALWTEKMGLYGGIDVLDVDN